MGLWDTVAMCRLHLGHPPRGISREGTYHLAGPNILYFSSPEMFELFGRGDGR